MAATKGSGVVSALLEALQVAPEASLESKGEATTLGEALTSRFEITAATPRFLDYWAQISEAEALRQSQQDDRDGERSVFLRTHHIVDIVRRFPVPGITAQGLIGALRQTSEESSVGKEGVSTCSARWSQYM